MRRGTRIIDLVFCGRAGCHGRVTHAYVHPVERFFVCVRHAREIREPIYLFPVVHAPPTRKRGT